MQTMRGKEMTYILFLVFITQGFKPAYSVSQFSTKLACETALKAVRDDDNSRPILGSLDRNSRCIEVKL